MPSDTVRYELPVGGTTLLGYIVRRMHKTELLSPIPGHLNAGEPAQALEQLALYAAASSTSYGRAYYQPQFNRTDDEVSQPDPVTGAEVTARLESRTPHYKIAYTAQMPNGDLFEGREVITGTKIGFSGLGMPAPSRFKFRAAEGDYTAELTGTITSELAPSLFRPWRIRAYGSLEFSDSAGNHGRLKLSRRGEVTIEIEGPGGRFNRQYALPH